MVGLTRRDNLGLPRGGNPHWISFRGGPSCVRRGHVRLAVRRTSSTKRVPMRRALAHAVVGAAALTMACAPPVALVRQDALRLRQAHEIAVVYRASPARWVECWPLTRADSVACDVEEQITARIRAASPVDPARATAERFLVLVRSVATGLRFRDPRPRTALTGHADPILLFETAQWALTGSHYSYRPWFVVRATLMESAGGRVLWRDSCAAARPSEAGGASPAELTAHGGALYGRLLRAEAERCAEELVYAFRPAAKASAESSSGAEPKLSPTAKDGLRIGP